MDENTACFCFALSDGVGPKTFLKLFKHFGTAKYAWENLSERDYKTKLVTQKQYEKFDAFRKAFNLEGYLEKLKKTKVKTVTYVDHNYPESLRQLQAPPIVLFCKGNFEILDSKRTIGVVGARKITSYGREVTEKLTAELVSRGFTIVSGLAFGVDAVAHKTTIENRGPTIAVLGCGVDCPYPLENQDLYEQILDNDGLIISEYPLGMPPSLGSFPARNRIIAGLSLGVLVTEAAEDSGSLITAEEAIKLNRPVFGVPGSIQSQMSRGALKLLKQGAILVCGVGDIMDNFQFSNTHFQTNSKEKILNLKLSTKEKMVMELVAAEALSLDFLAKTTGIPMAKLMAIVSSLEMKGIIVNSAGEIKLAT